METIKLDPQKTNPLFKNKKKLEKELKIKITLKEGDVLLEGRPLEEYFAKNVIEAIDFGFSINDALILKKEEFLFEIINIKNYTRSKNLERIRARIIGKKGTTLRTLSELTGCKFEIQNNDIGVIGEAENMKIVQEAIINLIRGTKQANTYSFLEKHQPKPLLDLGLKDDKDKEKRSKE